MGLHLLSFVSIVFSTMYKSFWGDLNIAIARKHFAFCICAFCWTPSEKARSLVHFPVAAATQFSQCYVSLTLEPSFPATTTMYNISTSPDIGLLQWRSTPFPRFYNSPSHTFVLYFIFFEYGRQLQKKSDDKWAKYVMKNQSFWEGKAMPRMAEDDGRVRDSSNRGHSMHKRSFNVEKYRFIHIAKICNRNISLFIIMASYFFSLF